MDEVVVQAQGLTKIFRSGDSDLTIFSELDLQVRRGEQLALVGESGAGKSTLLYLLAGLDRPTRGTIHFGARDLSAMANADLAGFRNREIGFVWQSHNLLPEFTARENVMMPLLIRGAPEREAADAAQARLEEVGIAARASHKAGELSGGEQQRAALARALSGNPSLLLADEPTGNLDHRTGEMIFELLTRLQRTRGLTLILVTHNDSFARRCDRILRLENGTLVPG
ncbi:MAG: ABC transporter ATP-binding protein [Acidobacteria bacterium]|nr:ABC transporter ATP-binding protein [Acidobacteriota bacterium]MBI3470414.1 ABC transporter ATP-binding protein [Candidatus Solibacter usitatus]